MANMELLEIVVNNKVARSAVSTQSSFDEIKTAMDYEIKKIGGYINISQISNKAVHVFDKKYPNMIAWRAIIHSDIVADCGLIEDSDGVWKTKKEVSK